MAEARLIVDKPPQVPFPGGFLYSCGRGWEYIKDFWSVLRPIARPVIPAMISEALAGEKMTRWPAEQNPPADMGKMLVQLVPALVLRYRPHQLAAIPVTDHTHTLPFGY